MTRIHVSCVLAFWALFLITALIKKNFFNEGFILGYPLYKETHLQSFKHPLLYLLLCQKRVTDLNTLSDVFTFIPSPGCIRQRQDWYSALQNSVCIREPAGWSSSSWAHCHPQQNQGCLNKKGDNCLLSGQIRIRSVVWDADGTFVKKQQPTESKVAPRVCGPAHILQGSAWFGPDFCSTYALTTYRISGS